MLSATSLDSTLEGLKQGNALEQEFIKKLKEGLEFIADNMQKECYNRTDALVEVRQKLAKVTTLLYCAYKSSTDSIDPGTCHGSWTHHSRPESRPRIHHQDQHSHERESN
jgi:hypothetical protein